MKSGKLVIFSAPSGAGKTTIVKSLLEAGLPLEFSISATSRAARTGEIPGKDYYFMTISEFQEKLAHNEFLEWQEVYPGSYYGTLKSELTRIWGKGKHVIFDVDVLGGINLKKIYPSDSLAIFVMPPSVPELEKRLRLRNTEAEEKIRQRVDKAVYELNFAKEFDKIIINDQLEIAKKEALETVTQFISG